MSFSNNMVVRWDYTVVPPAPKNPSVANQLEHQARKKYHEVYLDVKRRVAAGQPPNPTYSKPPACPSAKATLKQRIDFGIKQGCYATYLHTMKRIEEDKRRVDAAKLLQEVKELKARVQYFQSQCAALREELRVERAARGVMTARTLELAGQIERIEQVLRDLGIRV